MEALDEMTGLLVLVALVGGAVALVLLEPGNLLAGLWFALRVLLMAAAAVMATAAVEAAGP